MIVNIDLYVSELLYDIKNKTYLTAQSRSGEVDLLAQMQVNDDDENKNQITRSIETSYNTLLSIMDRYVSGATQHDSNKLSDNNIFQIELNMPDNFNISSIPFLKTACHNYIVCNVLADWLSIIKPDEVKFYESQATAYAQEVNQTIYKRIIPTR